MLSLVEQILCVCVCVCVVEVLEILNAVKTSDVSNSNNKRSQTQVVFCESASSETFEAPVHRWNFFRIGTTQI